MKLSQETLDWYADNLKQYNECQEDEFCDCTECQKAREEEAAFHLREYRLYCIKDDEGNLIDTRDQN